MHKFGSNKFCAVAPNIYGSLVWNLPCVTLLAPRVLKWLQDCWKICGTVGWIVAEGNNIVAEHW